jgi:hypothetical protein
LTIYPVKNNISESTAYCRLIVRRAEKDQEGDEVCRRFITNTDPSTTILNNYYGIKKSTSLSAMNITILLIQRLGLMPQQALKKC